MNLRAGTRASLLAGTFFTASAAFSAGVPRSSEM